MRYILMIHGEEVELDSAEQQNLMNAHNAFIDEAKAAGVYRIGEELHLSSTAKTLRVRNGEMVITDGPFAESKEQFGGYYVLDCQDLDEALNYAEKLPEAKNGSIEIRPIVDHSQPASK